MKHIKIGLVLIFGAMMLLAVYSSPHSAARMSTGDDLFKTKCTICHKIDGTPTGAGKALKAPDLRLEEVQKKTDDELKTIIGKGRNKMPAYGDKLTKEEIDQLLVFIRGLAMKQ